MKQDNAEKDLGFTFDKNFTFSTHIHQIISKSNSRVGIIKRTFTSLTKSNFTILYKSLVRPILEYCSQIWSPHLHKDINELEKVQRRATKLVHGLTDLPYEERLKQLDLPTLSYRRTRADILQTFRIFKGIDDLKPTDFFTMNTTSNTRGHNLKIYKPNCNTTERQHTFSQRVITIWNNLPSEVVNSEIINTFKSALECHWKNILIKYDPKGTFLN
jgi:ribonuclease P/MRP protein subunit RPP40